MDSLTHALVASIVFTAIGHPELVPFAALGAICPDADFVFQRFSDRDPKLYLFTHGGITHSILGALTVSAASAVLGLIAVTALGYSASVPLAFVAAVAGVLTHIGLDFLAFPGIPLLWPATDKKYTLGIAAGPTPYLLVASMVYGAFLLNGKASFDDPLLYVGFFALVMAVAAILKAWVTIKAKGMAIPGFSPLKWLIVADEPASYRVSGYHLLRGSTPAVEFAKLGGVSAEEAATALSNPEVKRMRYHSYIVTAARKGRDIIFSDPLREHGYLWYPPYYKSYALSPEAQMPESDRQTIRDNAGKA
ncbi:MAG TPA: metal-dependent hydrolase [Methanocella sp.]